MDDPKDTLLDEWIARCRKLVIENQWLRALLAKYGIDRPAPVADILPLPKPTPFAKRSSSDLNTAQKIAPFRSLFRGCEDVYAQRWESPDGRSGYSPKTERDWKAYYAAKPGDRKRLTSVYRLAMGANTEEDHLDPRSRPGFRNLTAADWWNLSAICMRHARRTGCFSIPGGLEEKSLKPYKDTIDRRMRPDPFSRDKRFGGQGQSRQSLPTSTPLVIPGNLPS